MNAGGSYTARPGSAYPPSGHPADHGFSWERGRVLGAHQILFITSGGGMFESTPTRATRLTAGDAVILFPQVWHRYRPDPATGWHEFWIELRGPVIERLTQDEVLSPRSPVYRPANREAVAAAFHRILEVLRESDGAAGPLTGAWALEVVATLHGDRGRQRPPRPVELAVAQAQRILAQNLASPPPLEKLSRDVSLGYSYFRREFKAVTGESPGHYLRRLRLEKAQRLLGTGGDTLKSIGSQLGFSSEFHFSTAFKKHFGVSPRAWRSGSASR